MVDDGTLFRLGRDNFRWIGGDDASLLWLRENAAKSGLQVYLRAATEQIHNVALQGPASRDILLEIIWTAPGQTSIAELGWFRFTIGRVGGYDGIPVMISRTGYTGELGYEIFCHPDPVSYTHLYWACREKAAIMDLSALRKMEIIGPDAEVFLQTMMPRDIRKLAPGQVVYRCV